MRHLRWAGSVGLILLLGFFVSVITVYPQLLRCYFIAYAPFVPVAQHTFISQEIPAHLRRDIMEALSRAEQRVAHFWGKLESKPCFIFCASEREFANYGTAAADMPAMVHLSPLGAYVVVQPDGVDEEVLAHELCHAELLTRLGWYIKTTQIPAWFDEGLAMRLDRRFPLPNTPNTYANYRFQWNIYTMQGKFAPSLQELRTIQGFTHHPRHTPHVAYITAGMEVARWYEVVGHRGLEQLIASLRHGGTFAEVYARLEQQAKANYPGTR